MRILNRLGGIELSQAYATIKAISKKKSDVIAPGPRAIRQGRHRRRDRTRQRGQDLRPDRELRRLRLQQVALDRLCAGRLSDGVPQGTLSDRVHGGACSRHEMDGQEREKFFYRTYRGLPTDGYRGAAAEYQRGAAHVPGRLAGRIHFGLGAIKGVGFKAVEVIVKARAEGGPFTSLDDFFERVPTKEVGAGCVETLIHAGAFDSLGGAGAAPASPPACPPGRPGQAG